MNKEIEEYVNERAIRAVIDIGKQSNWPEERIKKYRIENCKVDDAKLHKYLDEKLI